LGPKFTDGAVSAEYGPGGETSLLQVTIPVQPGNSGGPVVTLDGSVVGIVSSSAAIIPFLKATGTLPQNVNWAIKAEYAKPLFDQPQSRQVSKSRSEAIDHTTQAVCLVEATK